MREVGNDPGNEENHFSQPDHFSKQGFRISSCQSKGKERSHNEDSLFVFQSTMLGAGAPVSTGLFLVADGMGGHQHGEEASRVAAQTAGRFLIEKTIPALFNENNEFSDEELQLLVKEATQITQQSVLKQVPGSGTTLTFALVIGSRVVSAHVGDSRMYFLRSDGKMQLMTKDHSLVNRLVELGEISHSEAVQHPQRNVLYRALGQSDPLEPDISQFSIEKGERLLICSDGLWGVLDDKLIKEMISIDDDFDAITAELVMAANDAGGPDNISVVLVEKLV